MVQLRVGNEERTLTWEELEGRVAAGQVPGDAWIRLPGEDWRRAGELEWIRDLEASRASAFARAHARAGPPLVTALLVGVQIRVWWWARLPEVEGWVSTRWAKWGPPILEDGEVLRLLTMGFVHTGFAHALLNLSWLAYVGFHVERALGGRWLAVLYGTSVVGGSVASLLGAPGSPSLGASGGVFGLIAASVVFGFARPELLPERLRSVFGFALLPYLVLMFASGLSNAGTDNWSHAGGLLVGGLLAAVADPPGFERRPGWSTRWQVGAVLAAAALVGVIGLAGPRVEPLGTEAEVRAASLPPGSAAAVLPTESPLAARVPVGWRSGRDAFGGAAWLSPLGARTWGATHEVLEVPLSDSALAARWIERLDRAGWAHDLRPVEGLTLAGAPAAGLRGVVQLHEPVVVEWRGRVQGTQALVAVWSVEPAREARLAPLRDRLFASVTWTPPDTLAEALTTAARQGAPADARRAAAAELAAWGFGVEALDALRDLVDPGPGSAKDWVALLGTAAARPDAAPDARALIERAWGLGLGGRVDVAVVEALEALGEPTTARGVLDRAWAEAPGERSLARARRARGLSDHVLPSGQAATDAWDARADAPRTESLALAPRDLLTAAAMGAEAADAADAAAQVVAEAVAAGTDPLPGLVRLAWGHPLTDPAEVVVVLHGVRAAADGSPPAWWRPGLPEPGPLADALDARDPADLARAAPTWPGATTGR